MLGRPVAVHRFADCLARGQAAEQAMDRHFGRWFQVAPVPRQDERRGIDRRWSCLQTGAVYTVEYKADWRAGETGRAFLETWSVVEKQKPGWVVTSEAMLLAYYLPTAERVLVLDLATLKRHLPEVLERWPEREASSGEWTTRGVAVPVDYLAAMARHQHDGVALRPGADDDNKHEGPGLVRPNLPDLPPATVLGMR